MEVCGMAKKGQKEKRNNTGNAVAIASNDKTQSLSSVILNRTVSSNPNSELCAPSGKRPRVLFAVGDAEFDYTQGKIWRLAKRLQEQTGWDVVGVVHDEQSQQAGEKQGLSTWFLPILSPGITMQERLLVTNQMIDLTADLRIPGSEVPLWKILAMDDFVGSLHLFGAQPCCS